MAEFPATNILGYGVNMLGITPLDTKSATDTLKAGRRIISFDQDETRELEVDGKLYKIPKQIGVLPNVDVTSGFISFPSGNEAALAFKTDSSLSARFMSVTGDASVTLATEKLHRRNVQYAYSCYSQGKYMAYLRDYVDNLNNTAISSGVKGLPTPFNGEDSEVLMAYKDFFQRFGTHVITKVNYGAQLQLHIWAPNSNPAVNDAWAVDIKADYDGIPSGGEYDDKVKDTPQYKEYKDKLKQYVNSVYGGQGDFAQLLIIEPTYLIFEDWTNTTNQNSGLLTLVVSELWSLMLDSNDSEIRAFAPTLRKAFDWIANNPIIYKTAVTLSVESDWAEFGLLTPSAVIVPGEEVPTNTQYTEMKLNWGKEHSHQYERKEIRFYIVNDGYPIDFYISHGSSGGASDKGTARVTIMSDTYINDSITDNNYNTMWFYQASVNTISESFRVKPDSTRDAGVTAWDHVLDQYLRKVRAGA